MTLNILSTLIVTSNSCAGIYCANIILVCPKAYIFNISKAKNGLKMAFLQLARLWSSPIL